MMEDTWAVLMAGGRGTRFWPRSRMTRPKQCLALDGPRTMVQQTLDRLSGLVPPERVLVVTGVDMAERIAAQLSEIPAENVLVEPRGRNTAPCIAWAVAEVARRGGRAMVVLPSDHRIEDEQTFRAVVRSAVEAAEATGDLVLLGQEPTRPATAYGYLQLGERLGEHAGRSLLRVDRFVEKPARAEAERLLARGGHLWNGGMFVWTVAAITEALEQTLPATGAVVRELVGGASVDEVWDRTDATSIDYGVLERWDRIAAIPCSFGWSDLGGWLALGEILPDGELGRQRVAAGVALDGGGHIVDAPDKLVATLGVSDLVIVDTGDALLVCDRERAEQVPRILAELRERGLDRWL